MLAVGKLQCCACEREVRKKASAHYRFCCQEYLLAVAAVGNCASEQMGCEVTVICVDKQGSFPFAFVNNVIGY